MKQAEVISIAHARDYPEHAPFPPEARRYARRLRDAPKVRAVEAVEEEGGACQEDRRDDGAWIGVVGPVSGVKCGGPGDGIFGV